MKALTLLAMAVLGLSACSVGPDFQRPAASEPGAWPQPLQPAASQAVNAPLEERWWEVFQDERLVQLCRRVMAQNLDLQRAAQRLEQSRAARRVVTAERYPRLDASGGYARKRNSGEGLSDPSGNQGNAAYNLWEAGFSAAWEVDLWGRVRRQSEAADATLHAAEDEQRGILLAVLAETAQNYLQLRGVQNTRSVTEQNLEAARHSLQLTRLRLADGVATDLDVAEAAAQVATIDARLPALRQRQAQLINA